MALWFIIFWTTIVLTTAALIYLGTRVPHFFNSRTVAHWSNLKFFLISAFAVISFMGILTLCINAVNAIVCALYLAMIWAVSDFIFYLLEKFFNFSFQYYYAGWFAIIFTCIALSIGWYFNHHVWQTKYTLTTTKDVPDLRVALLADAHIGTTFDATGFAKHLQAIQSENPDVVVIVGDYVDDSTTKENMIKSTQALGKLKTKYGVYFVFGNHDKGYYGAARRGFNSQDLIDELQKNGIKVLRDENVLINDSFYLIGRRDYSEVREQGKHRKSMEGLTKNLDKNKYMIVLDHQPTDYKNQEQSQVDLVLSGHTHGGQLFPFNQVGKWIGANDLIYGHEKRGKTDFIVTSGISDWAIKFKTGTKSEYVIIDIQSK